MGLTDTGYMDVIVSRCNRTQCHFLYCVCSSVTSQSDARTKTRGLGFPWGIATPMFRKIGKPGTLLQPYKVVRVQKGYLFTFNLLSFIFPVSYIRSIFAISYIRNQN